MKKGIIIKNIAGKVTVKCEDNVYNCMIRGKVKKSIPKIFVGDKCEFDENNLSIEKIFDRKNELERPPVSNVDQILVFLTVSPEPDYYLIDKLIIQSKMIGVDSYLIISKKDIIDDDSFIKNIKSEYGDSFNDIIITSSVSNEGLEEIGKIINGKISVFVGQSGVGKSSLLNSLSGKTIQEVGDLSHKDDRGKNTTRTSEMFFYKNGIIIDSPGFNLLNIKTIESNKLKDFYLEIQKYADSCMYRSCDHVSNDESICGVKKALKDKKINPNRYNRYKDYYEYLKKEEQYKYAKKGKSFS